MDRGERDRFAARTDQKNLAYGESACVETPPEVFAALHREFSFGVDLTANEENHLLPQWFGPGSRNEDALAVPWGVTAFTGFSNPAYGSFLTPFLKKAVSEMHLGFTSVILLPLRAAEWYTGLVLPYADEVRHTPRITFWYKGKPRKTAKVKDKAGVWTGELKEAGAMFDSIIVVYRPVPQFRVSHHVCCPHFSKWDWRSPSAAELSKTLAANRSATE